MIELIVYPKVEGSKIVNNSPFCAKTENLLKIRKLDYKVKNFFGNPGKFENAKLPVITHEGKNVCDSSLIEKYLFSIKGSINDGLTNKQKATGFLVTKTLEEYFYWCLLYERWMIDENWKIMKKDYFSHLPPVIRSFFPDLIRKSVKKSGVGHGLFRHKEETILNMGREVIQYLSVTLGENTYLLGDKISSFDASFYAFIASIIHSPYGPALNAEVNKFKNLLEYDKRMFKELYE